MEDARGENTHRGQFLRVDQLALHPLPLAQIAADELQEPARAVDDHARREADRKSRSPVGDQIDVGERSFAQRRHAREELATALALVGGMEIEEGAPSEVAGADDLSCLAIRVQDPEGDWIDGEDGVVGGVDRAAVALLGLAQLL